VEETSAAEVPESRWVAFQFPGFGKYWGAVVLSGFAVQIQTVAIGWQVYDMTRNPFDLGLIGLSQFLPALLLVMVTGAVADRFPRRRIMGVCLAIEAVAGTGLLLYTHFGGGSVAVILALLAVFGTARAFFNPARQSILPNLVPPRHLGNAIAVNSTANHLARIGGPVAGGLLYGLSAQLAYGMAVAFLVISAVLVLGIPKPAARKPAGRTSWSTLSAGFRYIWSEKVVLGAVSLDLFAVLLGGATALMPVYARDILDLGPSGLGLLMAGPAIGAVAVGFYLMANPIRDHAGHVMFASVAGFGVFMLVFAFSETVWISVLAMILAGGCDMVSVFVRGTLIQLWTPDELRGRVNAVNQVAIGASNEFGAFRAGSMGALTGPVAAVALGGIGTLAIVALWMRWFPGLREIRRLDQV